MSIWRLILSEPDDPYTNMAVDEALLEFSFSENAAPVLRVYGWKPWAISLGAFQPAEEVLNLDVCAENNISFVRRITGGQAIFHSEELTYSIFCSKQDLGLPQSVKQSFKILTGFIMNFYKELGLIPYFAFQDESYKAGLKPDFCFAAREEFDILIDKRKIGGNAQKRSRDKIFQHGSIPLSLDIEWIKRFFKKDLSALKYDCVSLEDALGRKTDFFQLRAFLVESFQKTFGIEFSQGELSKQEQEKASWLKENKYSRDLWNFKRVTQKQELFKV